VKQGNSREFSEQAYQITNVGLLPLPDTRNIDGNQIRIEDCPFATAVVLTEDPQVANKLHQSYRVTGTPTTFQMRTELTRQWLAIMLFIVIGQLLDKLVSWLLRIGPNGCLNATDCGEDLILLNTEQISPPQIEQEVFTLSPNPIREGEDIQIPEEISFLYYDISDMSGQIHRYGKAIDQSLRTRDLPAGYYTILLYSKNTIHQAKLIIQ